MSDVGRSGRPGSVSSIFALILTLVASSDSMLGSVVTRTQVLELKAGWNSVWLEVDPLESEPTKCFEGIPVDIAATYFQNITPVQYIRDPREAPWKEPGWAVWYSGERPDAVVTDLFAIHGNRAFLVHATKDYTWRLKGAVSFRRLQWQPDSFNFVGFSVNPDALPTFASYFEGSPAHRGQKVYRLERDQWVAVEDAGGVRIESGHAYWVYSKGGSQYQGPVDVRPPGGGQFDFGNIGASLGIRFENNSTAPAKLTVEASRDLIAVPLAYVVRNLSTLTTSYPRLPDTLALAPLGAGEIQTLTLQVRRDSMVQPEQSGLLRVTTDSGSQYWFPVVARRSGLSASAANTPNQP